MSYSDKIYQSIQHSLIRAFAVVDAWIDRDIAFLQFQSVDTRISAIQLLRMAVRSNESILALIEEGCDKALKTETADDLQGEPFDALELIHFPPSIDFAAVSAERLSCYPEEIQSLRRKLRGQLQQALCTLDLLQKGEGKLVKIKVRHDVAEMNLYEGMQCLALNMLHYVSRLEEKEKEFFNKVVVDQ
jgi:hypothetical protein